MVPIQRIASCTIDPPDPHLARYLATCFWIATDMRLEMELMDASQLCVPHGFSPPTLPLKSPAIPPVANPGTLFADRNGATEGTRCFGTIASPGVSIAGTVSPEPRPGTRPPVAALNRPELTGFFPKIPHVPRPVMKIDSCTFGTLFRRRSQSRRICTSCQYRWLCVFADVRMGSAREIAARAASCP